MRPIPTLIALLALSACADPDSGGNSPDEEVPPPQATAPTEQAEQLLDQAEVLPDSPTETRRQELAEAMEQSREQTADPEAAREERRRLRQRRESAGPWWQDSGLISDLTLDDDQRSELERAATSRRQQRVTARQQLAEVQGKLSAAVREGSSERAEALIAERQRAQDALHESDADWLRTVVTTLDEDQLARLSEQMPEVLHPGAGRGEHRSPN